MELVLFSILLLLSFYLLYFFSEHYFIPSLDKISERFNLSSDISGATLMAIGSSAPELAVVIVSLLKPGNHESIGIGTIVGSALFNLFVIVGAVMIVKKNQKMIWQPLVRDLIFYALSIGLLVWFFYDGVFGFWEALTFVSSYIVYFGALFVWKKWFPYKDVEPPEEKGEHVHFNKVVVFLKKNLPKNMFVAFFLDIVVIGLLSWLLVTSAIRVSESLGISEIIIALTVVALGTSVPDLIASVVVAKQGRPGMAINNAVGSNIFDILIGLGFPFLLLFIFSSKSIEVDNNNLMLSFFLLMGSIIVLALGLFITKWKTNKPIGWLLILLYCSYLLYEIVKITGWI